jgi:hypothetical protein
MGASSSLPNWANHPVINTQHLFRPLTSDLCKNRGIFYGLYKSPSYGWLLVAQNIHKYNYPESKDSITPYVHTIGLIPDHEGKLKVTLVDQGTKSLPLDNEYRPFIYLPFELHVNATTGRQIVILFRGARKYLIISREDLDPLIEGQELSLDKLLPSVNKRETILSVRGDVIDSMTLPNHYIKETLYRSYGIVSCYGREEGIFHYLSLGDGRCYIACRNLPRIAEHPYAFSFNGVFAHVKLQKLLYSLRLKSFDEFEGKYFRCSGMRDKHGKALALLSFSSQPLSCEDSYYDGTLLTNEKIVNFIIWIHGNEGVKINKWSPLGYVVPVEMTISDLTRIVGEGYENRDEKDPADKRKCLLCRVEERNVISSCNHVLYCEKCSDGLSQQNCPIYQKPIERYIKIGWE